MALLNYTTGIQAVKTVSEIQRILASHGAKTILTNYSNAGEIESLSFQTDTPHGLISIELPINPEAVLNVLKRQCSLGKVPRRYAEKSQAVRVAWRIVKDWVEAQMAILETEMVLMEQIFLPYIISKDGRTLYNVMADSHFLLKGKE